MAYSIRKGRTMMTQILQRLISGGMLLASLVAAPLASAGVPIKLNAYAIHYGGQLVYRYQIQNNSASTIYRVSLGVNSPGKELPGPPWSLDPAYSDIPVALDTAHCKPFYAMDCMITVFQFDYMPEPKTIISMRGTESDMVPPPKVFSGAENILPGALSTVAELYVPPAYQSKDFLSATGEVFFLDGNTKNPDGTVVNSVQIPFTQVDVTPPTLSVTLSPAVIWPPNGKLVPVTANITVKDDYDPQPEIKLESITSSEMPASGDIQDATVGTDDRQFQLKATRKGTNLAGRIYTVIYSATDGSGNRSTARATVTVPHDQR